GRARRNARALGRLTRMGRLQADVAPQTDVRTEIGTEVELQVTGGIVLVDHPVWWHRGRRHSRLKWHQGSALDERERVVHHLWPDAHEAERIRGRLERARRDRQGRRRTL